MSELADAGCIGAEPFNGRGGPGLSFSLPFDIWASSGEAALRDAFSAIQKAIPGALIGDFEWPTLGSFDLENVSDQPLDAEPVGPSQPPVARTDFRVSVCAPVQRPMPSDRLLSLLSQAGCEYAKCFRRRPAVFVGEFVRSAETKAEAQAIALEALREVFQDARLVNLEATPGSTLDALSALTRERWRSDADVRAAASCLEQLGFEMGDEAQDTDELKVDAKSAVGRVFEVLTAIQVAHIRLGDGRILALTPRTPGLVNGFDSVRRGQNFECQIDRHSGTIEWAQLSVERPDAGESVTGAKRVVVTVGERVRMFLRRFP